MDPLSQALVAGSLAGVAATPKKLRFWVAFGALGGLLPDFDVLIRSAQDPLLALEYHRHFSHALIFAPVIGAVMGLLVWLKPSWRSFSRDVFLATTLGATTHGLLDALTSYGTHLLWPFSNTRFAWSLVAVVDPIPTLSALILLCVALLKGSRFGSGLALGCFALYLVWCGYQSHRVSTLQYQVALQRGHVPLKRMVKPTLGNTVVYRSVYSHDGIYWIDAIRAAPFSEPQLWPGEPVPAFQIPDHITKDSFDLNTQEQDLLRFGRLTDHHLTQDESGFISDVRFSMIAHKARPMWGISLDAQRPQEHVEYRVSREMSREERSAFFRFLFSGECEVCEPIKTHYGAPIP